MPKQHVILDATMLSSLMSCPRYLNFRFNKLLIPIQGKSNSLEAGSLVHHILEHFNRGLIAGKFRSDAIADGMAAGQEYLNGYKDDNKFMKDDSVEPTNMPAISATIEATSVIGYNDVFKTMEQYFEFYKSDAFTPIAAEEVRGKIIYEDDDIAVMWKAKFDLIADFPNAMIPVDYKTGKQKRTPISLNNQFIGQCLLTGSRNMIVDQIILNRQPIENRLRRVTISYTADKIAEWVNDVVPYYARMYAAYTEAQSFPPNFTHCENKYGWCMYKQACEDDRGIRETTLSTNFKLGKHWDISND